MQEAPPVTHSPATHSTPTPSRRLLALLLILPILAALAAVFALDHAKTHRPLFAMTNLVGPTTQSLLQGRGLTVCTADMGTPGNPICFHAARMPATAATIALGIALFGDRYLTVAIFKTLLLLLPIELAIYLVWQWLPASPPRRLGVVLLLLAPFAILPFLADVSNMLVDEGYSYSFLALALALLLFPRRAAFSRPGSKTRALLFALSVDGLYLSKSGMLPAVLVLLAAYLVLQRGTGLRIAVLLLVAAAPAAWALHQHHASGRYSLGTSLDGINFHKGNNPAFLQNFPPRQGDSLDWYDAALNRGQHFSDEWSFNDFHRHAAFDYLRTHPRQTLHGDLRKLDILFFSCKKYGSTASHGPAKLLEEAGLLLFRLLFWTAILSALYRLAHLHPATRLPALHSDPQPETRVPALHSDPQPETRVPALHSESEPQNRVPHISILRCGPSRPREPLSSAPPNPSPPSGPSNVNPASTSTLRIHSLLFLALTAACTAPYLAGFAYTRHVSILIYPSALFCCTLLRDPFGHPQQTGCPISRF